MVSHSDDYVARFFRSPDIDLRIELQPLSTRSSAQVCFFHSLLLLLFVFLQWHYSLLAHCWCVGFERMSDRNCVIITCQESRVKNIFIFLRKQRIHTLQPSQARRWCWLKWQRCWVKVLLNWWMRVKDRTSLLRRRLNSYVTHYRYK